VQKVLAHPLKDARDVVIHRSGQAEGFKYLPKPLDQAYWVQQYGLPKGPGDALNPVRMMGGRRSLWPPRDDNLFFYVQSDGSEVSATEYCSTYLQLINSLMQEARPMPWLG
jgi:hypothetical protein